MGSDFNEYPAVCECNLAKECKNIHELRRKKKNQEQGCQACGENVPLKPD